MKIQFNSPPSNPEESLGLSVRYAPAKRALAKWRWRFVVLLLTWPFLFYLGKYLYGTIWVNMPGYVEMEEIVLKTPVMGKVSRSLDAGSYLKKGETVVELENGQLRAEYEVLLEKGVDRKEGKKGRMEALSLARQLRDYKRERYRAMLKLGSDGAATEADVANSLAALQAAEKEVLNARADLEYLSTEKNTSDLRSTRARLAELQWKIENLKIRAPISGSVVQLYGKPGEWIPEGGEVATIRSDRSPFIQAYVEPTMAKYAMVGNLATILFMDGGKARAKVASVELVAHHMPSELNSPLLAKGESIVVVLETDSPLPKQYRIKRLPVNIRFDMF